MTSKKCSDFHGLVGIRSEMAVPAGMKMLDHVVRKRALPPVCELVLLVERLAAVDENHVVQRETSDGIDRKLVALPARHLNSTDGSRFRQRYSDQQKWSPEVLMVSGKNNASAQIRE